MILRWKLCLAIMVATSTLVVSGPAAAQEMPPPTDFDPGSPAEFGVPNGVPKGEPKGAVPKGAVPKGEPPDREPPDNQPPDREPPDNDKKLLEAGGDLSLPQQSYTDNDKGDDSRFPLWRVAGIILSAGLFLWAGYRVFWRG
jgi:hypothetical protein